MTLAARALLVGHADPLALLFTSGDDLRISEAVISKAEELQANFYNDLAEAIGAHVANKLARAMR